MSDTVLENRMTTLEEMMVRLTHNVQTLTENAQRSDKRLDRLAKNARRSDRRLDRLSKEMRDERKEWNKRWEQLRSERIAEQKEWDKRWEQSRQEWDKRWEQSREERIAEQKEWNNRWDKLSKDREAEKKEWDKRWGKLSNKWGTMVEDLVGPSLPRLLREVAPCPPDSKPKVEIRARRDHPTQKGRRFEMDGVVDCGKYALFCECKSTPEPADVTKLIRKLGQAREYFPKYADYQLLGAIASLHLESDLVQYASDKGILAFAVGKELMDVQNEAGFTPKHF